MKLDDATVAQLEAIHGDLLLDPALGVALKPFNEQTFDRFADEREKQPQDALVNMCTRHVVWPSAADFKAMRTTRSVLPSMLADALLVDAGAPDTGSSALVEPINESTPPGILEAAGLSRGEADALLSRHSAGGTVELSLVSHDGASIVLRGPNPSELAALQKAHAKGVGASAACRVAARDCAVWASEDLSALFARLPAFPSVVLLPEIMRLGGAGATRQFRRRRHAAVVAAS